MEFKMQPVYVNNLPLPPLLIELITNGEWKLPGNIGQLRELTRVNHPEDFSFLGVDGMIRETDGARRLTTDLQQAQGYGLYSSKQLGDSAMNSQQLDVDMAVLITVNWDEEAIFLDYRISKENPSVVLAHWPDNKAPAVHRQIARDFAEFVVKIGLR
jgi:hypothetical protein